MDELVAGLEFCSQVAALTGECERELQLHEGNVLLFGGRDVGLSDEDLGHRQGGEVAHFV